jgi:hypothetical protein
LNDPAAMAAVWWADGRETFLPVVPNDAGPLLSSGIVVSCRGNRRAVAYIGGWQQESPRAVRPGRSKKELTDGGAQTRFLAGSLFAIVHKA